MQSCHSNGYGRLHGFDVCAESLIWSAFFVGITLSFVGLLGQPILYALGFLGVTYGIFQFTRRYETLWPEVPLCIEDKWLRIGIFTLIGVLVAIALFNTPASADGQRIKLARMVLAVNAGSLWNVSLVDGLSNMYIFPSAFYVIFSAVEALHLPKQAYSIINTLLLFGAGVSLWRVFAPKYGSAAVLPIILVLLSPQLVFAALEEHEEALAFFLACRMLVWLVVAPLTPITLLLGVASAALAIWVKPSAIVFVPPALFFTAYAVHGFSGITRWFSSRNMLFGALSVAVVVPVILLPDMMVNRAMDVSFAENAARIGAYHARTALACSLPHFLLRIFELYVDAPRLLLSMVKIDISFVFPAWQMLPPQCRMEDVFLPFYFIPTAPTRETLQFGFLPWFAVLGMMWGAFTHKHLAQMGVLLLIVATLVYALKFSYWWGTGRYFNAAVLLLLPALIALFAARLSVKKLRVLVLLGLLPALFIASREIENIPRSIAKGDNVASRAQPLLDELATLHGPVNIYFNDLMPFYTLLRAIPSAQVSLKKDMLPHVQNVVAIPTHFSPSANWHDDYWLVPMPTHSGAFHFVGPVRKNFGNSVPSQFYIGDPAQVSAKNERFAILPYAKAQSPEVWAKANGFSARRMGKRVFVVEEMQSLGLCIVHTNDSLQWTNTTLSECGAQ